MQNIGKDECGATESDGKDEGQKFEGAWCEKDTFQIDGNKVEVAFKVPPKTLAPALTILKEFGYEMLETPRGSKFGFEGCDVKLHEEIVKLCSEAFKYGLKAGIGIAKQQAARQSRILRPDGLGPFAKSLPMKGGKDVG